MAGSSPLTEATRVRLSACLLGCEQVVAAYLFGSHARGEAGPLSDVDIALLLDDDLSDEAAFDLRLTLIGGLSEVLGTNAVDVLILNGAPVALSYRVFRDGIPLLIRDPQRTTLFRARVVDRYLDFEPIRQRHERAILERAGKGTLLDGHDPHRGALERYRRLRRHLEGAP